MIEESLIISTDRSRTLPMFWIVAIVYLVALGIAEALTTLIAPLAGMILHGLILITLLIHAAFSTNKRMYRFLVVLALAPLIRLLSLTLPLIHFPQIYWYLVIGIPLYLAAYLCARLTGLKGSSIGLRLSWRAIPTQLLIGISGLLLGYIEYLILHPEPLVADLSWATVLLSGMILLVFTGLLEEIIFRGMMQTSATQNFGRLGILYVAILFAILHLGYRSLIDVLFVFAVAVLFGYLVYRTGTLAGVSLSHGLTNISLYLIFPILLANPVINNSASTTSISPEDIAPILVFQATATLLPRQTDSPFPSQTRLEDDIAIPITGSTNDDEEINAPSIPALILLETTPAGCSPPPSWVVYTVQAGDTPEMLSTRYGVDISALLFISCLETADQIIAGQQIFVPIEVTSTPTSFPSSSLIPPTDLPPTKPPKKQQTQEPTSTNLPTKSPTPTKPPTATNTHPPPPTLAPTLSPVTKAPPSQPPYACSWRIGTPCSSNYSWEKKF